MDSKYQIGVIIVAAGAGRRMEGDPPKQWRPLGGQSCVERSWRSFLPSSLLSEETAYAPQHMVLVVDEANRRRPEAFVDSSLLETQIVVGGGSRTESVRRGLAVLPDNLDLICVHDAVRPFWPVRQWPRLFKSALVIGGAILGVPISDTVKRCTGLSCSTVDRTNLWAVQTPQLFKASFLREAHAQAEEEGIEGTDDAELLERSGGMIEIINPHTANLKITTPEDWVAAEQILSGHVDGSTIRVGIGYDVHALGGDGPLMLGGVQLERTGGLIGHSDGDALLHAICDALLGAATCGDIGRHFSPGDPTYTGIDSRILLRKTGEILSDRGFIPVHVDAVIIAEEPRLAPHIHKMREAIAQDLHIPVMGVSVKATTSEGMGFVGRKEGIAVQAVATVGRVGGRGSGD